MSMNKGEALKLAIDGEKVMHPASRDKRNISIRRRGFRD